MTKRRHRLPTYLEPEELAALLAAAPPRRQLFYLLCARVGLRVSEAVSVSHSDIQWHDGEPSILHVIGKGDKEALLPLAPSLRNLLIQFSAPDAQGWLFPGYRAGHHLADRQARYWLVEDAGKAGIPRHKAHPHALRHSLANHLLREGVNLREIMDLMRHASLSITTIYLHTTPERLQDAVDVIDATALPLVKTEPLGTVLRHTEAAVLEAIRARPGITGEGLADHLSRLVSAVNRDLRELLALGHVIADGRPRRLYAAHDNAVAHVGPREVARYSGGLKAMYATVKAHHNGHKDTEEELRLLGELERITRRRLELLGSEMR